MGLLGLVGRELPLQLVMLMLLWLLLLWLLLLLLLQELLLVHHLSGILHGLRGSQLHGSVGDLLRHGGCLLWRVRGIKIG